MASDNFQEANNADKRLGETEAKAAREVLMQIVASTQRVIERYSGQPNAEISEAFGRISSELDKMHMFLPPGPAGAIICGTCLRPF